MDPSNPALQLDRMAPLVPQIRAALMAIPGPPSGALPAELLDLMLAWHDHPHVCGLAGGAGTRIYGAGLPFGPNCPALMACAAQLEAALVPDAGTPEEKG